MADWNLANAVARGAGREAGKIVHLLHDAAANLAETDPDNAAKIMELANALEIEAERLGQPVSNVRQLRLVVPVDME